MCEIEKHPTLYHPDGDIVLSTKLSDTTRQLFRVHKIFLSHQSDIFRDMFQVVSAESNIETFEGVPLVTMPDHDCSEDVAVLLEVIYKPSLLYHVLSSPQRSDTPMRVGRLANIAKKYLIDDIVKSILDHMTNEWLTTLAAWDEMQNELAAKLKQGTIGGQQANYQEIEALFPEPVSAILFAQEHELRAILPDAFYRLSITRTVCDWDHMRRSETVKPAYEPSARWALLDRDNLFHLVKGRERLHRAFHSSIEFIQHILQEAQISFCKFCDCEGGYSEACADNVVHLGKIIGGFTMEKLNGWDSADVFALLDKLKDCSGSEEIKLCTGCSRSYCEMVDRYRNNLWKEIPRFFGYPIATDMPGPVDEIW